VPLDERLRGVEVERQHGIVRVEIDAQDRLAEADGDDAHG
jgi:hypothetical protein